MDYGQKYHCKCQKEIIIISWNADSIRKWEDKSNREIKIVWKVWIFIQSQ
jgi:hypothetical protein